MTPSADRPPQAAAYALNPWRQFKEGGIRFSLFACALVSVVTTFAIAGVVFKESLPFFSEVSVVDFLFGTEWTPFAHEDSLRRFGVLPLIAGTMMIVVLASIIAIPMGLGCAIYLSEFASPKARNTIKPILEVLAGIPTVVYGFFALVFLTPALRAIFPSIESYNALSASIVVGVMVLPLIASLCDDALRAVPSSMRQAGYAVGATKLEVTTRIVLPSALSGIFASVVLAMSRAIGESMAVTLAAGALPQLTSNPLDQIQTMTGYVVSVSKGETPVGSVEYQSIFAVSLVLFLITLLLNVVSNRVLKRYREVYE